MIDETFFESEISEDEHVELEENTENIKERVAQIFPYTQYKGSQAKIISTISHLPSNGKLMIEADTGSGKTIATLSALLARKKPEQKIIIFVKTINQFNPILREWQRIENRNITLTDSKSPRFLILPMLGKKRICSNEYKPTRKTIISCNREKMIRHKQFLRLTKKNKRSRLLRGINLKLLSTSSTISDFTRIIQEKENCPYYNTRSILKEADIVVTTYPYLQPRLFKSFLKNMEIKVEDSLILVDEAHNLAFPHPTELTKVQFDIFTQFFCKNQLLEILEKEFRGVRILDLNNLMSAINVDLQRKQLLELISILLKNNMLIQLPDQFQLDPEKISIVTESVRSMKSFLENLEQGDLIITKEYIKITNLSILQTFVEQEKAESLVLQSATLTPIDSFRKIFGLSKKTKILDLIERDIRVIAKNRQQFRASYTSAVSSESRFRNERLFERYAEIIIKLQRVVPMHTLVLSPSYDFLELLMKALQAKILEIPTLYLPIIVETPTSSQKQLYDNIISLKSNGIILGNQNGKILEGNEWVVGGKSIVNMVIFTGISSLVPQEELDLLDRIRENIIQDKRVSHLFQNRIPLYIQAKQALGRVIRGVKDLGVLIILDHRADDFLHNQLWLSRYSIIHELIEDIREFFSQ